MLVHRRITPGSKFAGAHLYTWVKRGTMRVKCLAQEQRSVPTRDRTRTGRSGVQRTNRQATAPQLKKGKAVNNYNGKNNSYRYGPAKTCDVFTSLRAFNYKERGDLERVKKVCQRNGG